MKFSLFLVLALSAMAAAGPAFTKNNQIENQKQQQQQQQGYMTAGATNYDDAKSPAIDILKQWCFSSQMSQQELTASFKKLVGVVKSSPVDQTTEAAVMSERICQGALVQKSQQSGQTYGQTGADAKAHELIKDVYMDALISCRSRECTQQLLKVISSQQVDAIRASYYMTRMALTDGKQMQDGEEVKQFAESFVQQQQQSGKEQSEAVERQKLFATTSLIGKSCEAKPNDASIKELAHKVAQSIVERYIKPVQQQEVQQYKQTEQPSAELAKKIAKRGAAIKALANIPGHIIGQISEVEQTLVELAKNKEELVTVRQSAIECLEQNEKQMELLKQIALDQEEPIECRVAAYRALMTVAYQGESKSAQNKEQVAQQIVDQIVKHCEQHQQQDEQFVLYAVSHLENLRTSQQPEHQAIKECISKNKQHYMQIQVLSKKLKQQLNDVRRSSRNYKLEQEFNQLESGLVLEGDIIYESQQHKQSPQQVLPKLVRVNMSMPIMGETVNVIELTLRQNQMDEELLGALKMVSNTKFNSESVNKVVDSFKSTVEKQQQQQQQQQQQGRSNTKTTGSQAVEADLTIKVDGCTVVYLCADDIKAAGASTRTTYHSQQQQQQHERNTRSVYSQSIVEDVVEFLKREPINFNRGFNVNINERIAKLLDIDANILAGLRFESSAQGTADNLEIVAQMEPRFGFEAVVGPAKMSKKLLTRLSTKTAAGLRLRFKKNELVDIKVELPMNQMELFTVESQLVEKSRSVPYSYNYLPESIYGQEDIYAGQSLRETNFNQKNLAKRSIYGFGEKKSTIGKLFEGKSVSETFETPETFARATGLRGSLRFAASTKDMSYLVSCLVQKEEPSMEGYRVRIEKTGRQAGLMQYQITVSTPGSRTERTVSIRVAKQMSQERSLIKAEFQAPRMAFAQTIELIHDGRQYALKTELVSRDQSRKQWRHSLDCGIVSGSQAAAGRLAQFAYRPYLQIESTLLKRPVALQGQIAYQQSPKSVISYELKCPTTGSFVQGKLIVDQRDASRMSSSAAYRKRTASSYRRSAQSPIELLMSMDITLTHEMSGQWEEHTVKVHNMADWSCQKYALEADSWMVYKNAKRASSGESKIVGQLKINEQQQLISVERKSAQDERNDFVVRVNSIVRPTGHQMEAECRYNGRRQSLAAYKHKVEVQKVGQNKYDTQVEVEIVDTEHQINEKFQGRARVQNERRQKGVQVELASRQKLAKVNFDYESLSQHQLQVVLKSEQFEHKCELRNSPRQFFVQSRTENKQAGYVIAKSLLDIQKASGECKLVVEAPAQRVAVAADLKLESGKRSSLAIQTPRFATQGEFTFETVARPIFKSPLLQNNLRFRSSLKDLVAKKAYWMDSAINAANMDKESSFIRFDSPVYRTDLEFDPREQVTKFATFARSKRSADHFDSIYSSKDSSSLWADSLNELSNKLNLGNNKLWMVRSVISSPFARQQLKQQARNALFQYADRVQSQQHQFNYSPAEQRLSMELSREPNTDFVSQSTFAPLRAKANWHADYQRPSTVSLSSEWMDMDMEMSPFGQEQRYAKISALSRHPRSAFKKHESEIRYNKDQGYKAYMKHQDSKNKEHKFELEADAEPHKYAKMAWASEKSGKANWEHKWRKEQQKRSFDEEPVYKNRIAFKREGPSQEQFQHETSLDWEEPVRMAEQSARHYQKIREQRRHRRSYTTDDQLTNWSLLNSIYDNFDQLAALNAGRYSPVEYLKHTNARLVSSQGGRNAGQQLYKLDFDYQPSQNYARLNVNMPDQMMHSSELQYKPDQSLYKLQSKLYNQITKEPSYEFLAATKPYGLASAEQEPVFVQSEHPMFERPVSKESLVYNLFKQPMKLDYSDKFGRVASLDYDHSPVVGAGKYAGLRQKRAAIYYKDNEQDLEHTSTYDFYPETFMGKLKPAYYKQQQKQFREQQPRDVAFKTQTKYGPIVVRADSTNEIVVVDVASPVMNAKLVGQTGANMRQLIKIELDNKQQRVQLSKILREAPASISESKLVKKIARKFDSGRFEHKSEVLVSIVDAIFKIKSQSSFNERPVIVIDAEWNQQQQKAFAKVNGERINGQAVIDLVRNSADLVVDVDDKHTLHHVTRLVQTSDKFYSLESMTTYKSRPILKLIGSVSAMMFEPSHLFSRRPSSSYGEPSHVSQFEAVIYEPSEYRVSGQFDCDKKEARIVFKNVEEEKQQETFVRYDQQTETIYVDSRLSSRGQGQVYAAKAKLSLPGLYQADECVYQKYPSQWQQQQQQQQQQGTLGYGASSCQSDVIYADRSGNWSAKYVPGEYVAVSTPKGKQTINLAGYVY